MCVHWIGKDKKANGSRWTQLEMIRQRAMGEEGKLYVMLRLSEFM